MRESSQFGAQAEDCTSFGPPWGCVYELIRNASGTGAVTVASLSELSRLATTDTPWEPTEFAASVLDDNDVNVTFTHPVRILDGSLPSAADLEISSSTVPELAASLARYASMTLISEAADAAHFRLSFNYSAPTSGERISLGVRANHLYSASSGYLPPMSVEIALNDQSPPVLSQATMSTAVDPATGELQNVAVIDFDEVVYGTTEGGGRRAVDTIDFNVTITGGAKVERVALVGPSSRRRLEVAGVRQVALMLMLSGGVTGKEVVRVETIGGALQDETGNAMPSITVEVDATINGSLIPTSTAPSLAGIQLQAVFSFSATTAAVCGALLGVALLVLAVVLYRRRRRAAHLPQTMLPPCVSLALRAEFKAEHACTEAGLLQRLQKAEEEGEDLPADLMRVVRGVCGTAARTDAEALAIVLWLAHVHRKNVRRLLNQPTTTQARQAADEGRPFAPSKSLKRSARHLYSSVKGTPPPSTDEAVAHLWAVLDCVIPWVKNHTNAKPGASKSRKNKIQPWEAYTPGDQASSSGARALPTAADVGPSPETGSDLERAPERAPMSDTGLELEPLSPDAMAAWAASDPTRVEAAARLQAYVRGKIARRDRERWCRIKAALDGDAAKLRSFRERAARFRRAAERANASGEHFRRAIAATRIQARHRGKSTRRETAQLRAFAARAARFKRAAIRRAAGATTAGVGPRVAAPQPHAQPIPTVRAPHSALAQQPTPAVPIARTAAPQGEPSPRHRAELDAAQEELAHTTVPPQDVLLASELPPVSNLLQQLMGNADGQPTPSPRPALQEAAPAVLHRPPLQTNAGPHSRQQASAPRLESPFGLEASARASPPPSRRNSP